MNEQIANQLEYFTQRCDYANLIFSFNNTHGRIAVKCYFTILFSSGSLEPRKKMADRVYKESLPELRNTLEKLKEEFSNLGSKTDWIELRIDPLLKHLESLEQLLHSGQFSGESSRLRRGVELFHSDLVYFRTNVKGLKEILQSEKKISEDKKQVSKRARARK